MRTSLENQAAIRINRRPLKFYCAACAKAINVKYLQKGDKARCPACGKLNIVPPNAVETDEKPNYIKIRSMIAGENQEQTDSKKLLSTKRVTGSALVASLAISILHSMNKGDDSVFGFILAFFVAYCIEYMWPSRTKKRKLTHEIARQTQSCYVCDKHINRGELCYSEFDWRSFLAKTRRYYCLKCYEEIFITPDAPVAKLNQPERKFKLFPKPR